MSAPKPERPDLDALADLCEAFQYNTGMDGWWTKQITTLLAHARSLEARVAELEQAAGGYRDGAEG